MIRKNVRTPDETMGDLWAQVVALDLMEDRLLHLMAQAEPCRTCARLAQEIQSPLRDGDACGDRRFCRTAPITAHCRRTD